MSSPSLLFFVLLSVLLFSQGVLSNPINWNQQISVGNNAGWGRFLVSDVVQGSILTYTEYDHPLPSGCNASYNLAGPIVQVYSSSQMNGTYQQIGWIPSPPNHIQEQSFLFQIQGSDRLLLVMRNRQPDCNWFGLPVVYSDDQGQTWNFLSQLDQTTTPTGLFNRGLWEPFLYQLPSGCIAGFYADETHADDGWNQIVGERVSCDGGQTWGDEIFAAGLQDGVSRPGMPGVARLSDGSTILVFETCGSDNCNIHYRISSDGVTWGQAGDNGLGFVIPNQTNGPYVQVTPQGRIIVTSACTNAISLSDDNGNSWYLNDQPAFNNDCSTGAPFTWPAVYNVPNSGVAVAVSGLSPAIQIEFGSY